MFTYDLKRYGFKIAMTNKFIEFAKWVVGAKRIQITYYRKNGKGKKKLAGTALRAKLKAQAKK